MKELFKRLRQQFVQGNDTDSGQRETEGHGVQNELREPFDRWREELESFDKRLEESLNPFTPDGLDLKLEIDETMQEESLAIDGDVHHVLFEIIDAYIEGTETTRDALLEFYSSFQHVRSGLWYHRMDQSSDEVRRSIAFLSIYGFGSDPRDYYGTCFDFFKDLDGAGIDYQKELREVVEIADNGERMLIGSVKSLLEKWLK